MAEMFAITSPQTEPLKLDGLGRGQFRVRVVNLSGRALFTEAHILPEDDRVTSWFEVTPPVDRHYAIGASYDYLVKVRAKALARPGTYKYRFLMKITDAAGDEPDTQSDELSLTLTRRILPWRTLLVVLAFLIAVGAVIGAFFASERITTNRLVPTITALSQDRQFLDREGFGQAATLQAQETRIAEATAILVPQATRLFELETNVNSAIQTIERLNNIITELRIEVDSLNREISNLRRVDVAISAVYTQEGRLLIVVSNLGTAASPSGNLQLTLPPLRAIFGQISVPSIARGGQTTLPFETTGSFPAILSSALNIDLEIAGDQNLTNNHWPRN